jgi:WD40 repeat protein
MKIVLTLIKILYIDDDRFCFASGAPDNIKIWKFPDGNFLQNFSGHQAIVNTVAINSDNVLVSGGKTLTINFVSLLNLPVHKGKFFHKYWKNDGV